MTRKDLLKMPELLNNVIKFVKKNTHPFPFINELKDTITIQTFSDVVKINDYVFSYVPWVGKDFVITERFNQCENQTVVNYMYTHFKLPAFIGGWCGLNTDFLIRLLRGYEINCRAYNFGIANTGFTHMGTVVEIDGEDYFFDSYFGKHYIWNSGNPINFLDLKDVIKNKEFYRITAVYANRFKPVYLKEGLLYMDPVEFEKTTVDGLIKIGLIDSLIKYFDDKEFMNLFLIGI
jgi:hypothetical protein